MPGYAAFLRGINLGARRQVSGADLRSLFEGIGLGEVATFRTSGNVVFGGSRGSPASLTRRIQTGLAESLGFEVAVFLRTADEIRTMADRQPFEEHVVEASRGKLQVVMLPGQAEQRTRTEVLALATAQDRLTFGDRELYWLPSGGTRDSGLNFKAIETLLGPTTIRTKGTIDALAEKHFPA